MRMILRKSLSVSRSLEVRSPKMMKKMTKRIGMMRSNKIVNNNDDQTST